MVWANSYFWHGDVAVDNIAWGEHMVWGWSELLAKHLESQAGVNPWLEGGPPGSRLPPRPPSPPASN